MFKRKYFLNFTRRVIIKIDKKNIKNKKTKSIIASCPKILNLINQVGNKQIIKRKLYAGILINFPIMLAYSSYFIHVSNF